MSVLRVEAVEVRFGGVTALAGVDVEAAASRVTGLIGPNGAGKTTLFNVITGLQTPTAGRVFLDDRDITDKKPHQRARLRVARTFQRLEVFGSLTTRENIMVAAEACRGWSDDNGRRVILRSACETRVTATEALVGCDRRRRRRSGNDPGWRSTVVFHPADHHGWR